MEYLHKNPSSIKDSDRHIDVLVADVVQYDDMESIEHVLLQLKELQKKDSEIIECIFDILRTFPSEKIVPALVSQLEQGNAKYRMLILQGLSQLPDVIDNDQLFDAIVNLLSDSNVSLRSMVVSVLTNMRKEKALIELRKHVIVEENTSILTKISLAFTNFSQFKEGSVERIVKINADEEASFRELITLFKGIIPGFKVANDVYDIEEGYTLSEWLYEVVLGEEYCVYVEKYQYDVNEFNALVPIKCIDITLSDDQLYDENDELIDTETAPRELFVDHLNMQLEAFNLMLIELDSHENPTFVCISTIDEDEVKKLYTLLNTLDSQ